MLPEEGIGERMSDTEGQRVDSADVLGHSLEAILAEASNPEDSLASGSAAALSVALAAALTCSAARSLEGGAEASGFVVQAENLRMRAVELVEQNRGHYEAARGALEERLLDPGYRDHRIGVAMKDTLDTLGLIAGTGADTAELAANVAGIATAELRPDAVSAASLAEAGVQVATILITANLLSSSGGAAQVAAEGELAAAAASSARARAVLA
jgi:formiminotetrahydrofolate cyclodeaminase